MLWNPCDTAPWSFALLKPHLEENTENECPCKKKVNENAHIKQFAILLGWGHQTPLRKYVLSISLCVGMLLLH